MSLLHRNSNNSNHVSVSSSSITRTRNSRTEVKLIFRGRSDSRRHWYSPSAIAVFRVRTDQQSYSTADLHYKRYGVLGGSGNVISGFTDRYSPYVNAIANDAVLRGREALGLWVHELGNSLSYITGISAPVAKDAADRYDGDTDQGTAFEDCVFGGHVTPEGIIPPKP